MVTDKIQNNSRLVKLTKKVSLLTRFKYVKQYCLSFQIEVIIHDVQKNLAIKDDFKPNLT